MCLRCCGNINEVLFAVMNSFIIAIIVIVVIVVIVVIINFIFVITNLIIIINILNSSDIYSYSYLSISNY